MELYIEYIIIDNSFIDYSIMGLIELTIGVKIKKINKLLVCCIGTGCAFILPYLYGCRVALVLFRLLTSIILVLLIKKYKSFKNFATYYLLFMTYTFLIGGAVLGVINMLGLQYRSSSIIMYSYELPLGVFGVILLLVIRGVMCMCKLIKRKLKSANSMYDVRFYNNGDCVDCLAFFDTGNNITCDSKGVIIISIETLLKLYKDVDISIVFGDNERNDIFKEKKYLSVSGVGKSEKYLSFVIDNMMIGKRNFKCPRIAVAMKNFQDFDCILHKDYVEGV